MSVYVDAPVDYGDTEVVAGYVGRARKRAKWCHMIADTEAELHAMATRLGLRREWHQRNHYDLVPSKRTLAIRLGALAVTRRELVGHLRRIGYRSKLTLPVETE